MSLNLASTVSLRNGVRMPILGLGTYKLEGRNAYQPVRDALEIGYQMIDTASFYENEEEVGRALRESGISREEIFVTSKVWNSEQGFRETLESFERSLRKLRLDCLDLYLIHWPVAGKRLETWRALEKLYDEGRCRAIGASNFMIRHLEELRAPDSLPLVDQVEFSPFLFRKDLMDYCRRRGIQLEAYSPLARGKKFQDPRLMQIARSVSKSPAQVMIRWSLQKGLVCIPKASSLERVRENSQVFDFQLGEDQMTILDSLNENFRTTTWDPEEM